MNAFNEEWCVRNLVGCTFHLGLLLGELASSMYPCLETCLLSHNVSLERFWLWTNHRLVPHSTVLSSDTMKHSHSLYYHSLLFSCFCATDLRTHHSERSLSDSDVGWCSAGVVPPYHGSSLNKTFCIMSSSSSSWMRYASFNGTRRLVATRGREDKLWNDDGKE